MPLDSLLVRSSSEALATWRAVDDARAAEEIGSVVHDGPPFPGGPARGILIGVVTGTGAWMVIFAAIALAREIFLV